MSYRLTQRARHVLIRVWFWSLTPLEDASEATAWDQLRLTERQFPSLLSLDFEVFLGPDNPFFYDSENYHTNTSSLKRENQSLWSYIINLTQTRPPLVKSLTITYGLTSSSSTLRERVRSGGALDVRGSLGAVWGDAAGAMGPSRLLR